MCSNDKLCLCNTLGQKFMENLEFSDGEKNKMTLTSHETILFCLKVTESLRH